MSFIKKSRGELVPKDEYEGMPVNDNMLTELEGTLNQQDTTGQVQAIKELFRDEKDQILMKSEIDMGMGEAFYFSRLILLSKVLHMPLLNQYVSKEMKVRVSNKRKGRIETVEMTRTTQVKEEQRGLFARLLGK